jgi:hypothetical protein
MILLFYFFNFRSPWSNKYYPASSESLYYPPQAIRTLEEKMNAMFAEYARLYYENCKLILKWFIHECRCIISLFVGIRK